MGYFKYFGFSESSSKRFFEAEVNFLKEYILKRFDITDEIVMNASFETVTKNIEKRGGHHRNYKDKKSKQEKIYNNFLLNQEDKK
jgi:hypothetical protein